MFVRMLCLGSCLCWSGMESASPVADAVVEDSGENERAPAYSKEQIRARSRHGLAVREYEAQRYAKAAGLAEEALQADPAYGSAAILLAMCSLELRDLRAAADNLTRAVNLHPQDPDLFQLLVSTHRKLDEWGAAEDLLAWGVEQFGRQPDLLWESAEVALAREHWSRAEELLLECKRVSPSDVHIRLRLLDLYEASESPERAIAEGRELLQLFPDDLSLTLRYVHVLLVGGREEDAVVELERLVTHWPEHQTIREMLVQIYAESVPNPVRWRFHEARLKELRQQRR